jgi:chorismate mutase
MTTPRAMSRLQFYADTHKTVCIGLCEDHKRERRELGDEAMRLRASSKSEDHQRREKLIESLPGINAKLKEHRQMATSFLRELRSICEVELSIIRENGLDKKHERDILQLLTKHNQMNARALSNELNQMRWPTRSQIAMLNAKLDKQLAMRKK